MITILLEILLIFGCIIAGIIAIAWLVTIFIAIVVFIVGTCMFIHEKQEGK